MKIPVSLKTRRFYVATSMTQALSSWSTHGEAMEAYARLKGFDEDVASKVIGIVEVTGICTTKHRVRPMEYPTVPTSVAMGSDEYQQLALRTDGDFLTSQKFGDRFTGISVDIKTRRLLHGAIGCGTEAGELLDQVKRHIFYGKDLDAVNVMEECGDLLWYIALTLDSVGYTLEEAMAHNIDKLRARYPKKFTEEAALNRDLVEERKILEDKS